MSVPLRCSLVRISALTWPALPIWFSASEQARLDGLSHPQRQRSFVAGRWLARELAAGWRAAPQLDIDEQGRSSVQGEPALRLSISHSGDWVACAVATAPIGIDIEALGRRRDFSALALAVHSQAQCAD